VKSVPKIGLGISPIQEPCDETGGLLLAAEESSCENDNLAPLILVGVFDKQAEVVLGDNLHSG
jgi:hypothetical protein